jgi:hypothetical protein
VFAFHVNISHIYVRWQLYLVLNKTLAGFVGAETDGEDVALKHVFTAWIISPQLMARHGCLWQQPTA